MPGNHFPVKNLVETHKSETQTAQLSLSLFADPHRREERIRVWNSNNKRSYDELRGEKQQREEEKLEFGKDGAGGIRML